MFAIPDVARMSSTLVETVSIDYEDFNDSFLTCGTCLCMYDSENHTPKLLTCSHTVCRSCLEHILEAQSRDSTTVRCPICRETVNIPRGGVGSFPPSFIVNQLLDLMARQRRDIIPKCSMHSAQELMFCETCDTVFCIDCTGGSHNGRGSSAHTVIPFSIAIKRMSEILLYKASLCMRNLNNACEIVGEEIQKLDVSAENCVESVNRVFQDVVTAIDQRRHEVVQMVCKIRDDKKRVLKEQLDIIEAEKIKVQTDCQGLQHQVEVRNITKKISDLNEKLDMSTTLSEPRENAFMRFEHTHNSAMNDLRNALNSFGTVKISKTFPALCTAWLEKSVRKLKTTVTVTTVDYHGNPRTSGCDPLVTRLTTEDGDIVPTEICDHDNGTYTVTFIPLSTGTHKLHISIFDRPVRESPFAIDVTEHNNPVIKVGSRGSGVSEFLQPVSAVIGADDTVYVLDTGNSRIKVLDREGRYIRHIGSHGLEQHSGTGLALTPSENFVVINWRTKYVTELNMEGAVIQKFTCAEFVYPTSVAVNRHGEFFVADDGKLFGFDAMGKLICRFGSKGDKPGQFKQISSVFINRSTDEILVTDTRLQVFSRNGKYLYDINSGNKMKGLYGGVTIDRHGNILATRSEKGKCFVEVYNSKKEWLLHIDSFDDKLKRPSGLATFSDGRLIVVDLGNDCVKYFRYI